MLGCQDTVHFADLVDLHTPMSPPPQPPTPEWKISSEQGPQCCEKSYPTSIQSLIEWHNEQMASGVFSQEKCGEVPQ